MSQLCRDSNGDGFAEKKLLLISSYLKFREPLGGVIVKFNFQCREIVNCDNFKRDCVIRDSMDT